MRTQQTQITVAANGGTGAATFMVDSYISPQTVRYVVTLTNGNAPANTTAQATLQALLPTADANGNANLSAFNLAQETAALSAVVGPDDAFDAIAITVTNNATSAQTYLITVTQAGVIS